MLKNLQLTYIIRDEVLMITTPQAARGEPGGKGLPSRGSWCCRSTRRCSAIAAVAAVVALAARAAAVVAAVVVVAVAVV